MPDRAHKLPTGPCLVMDACSSNLQVGVWKNSEWLSFHQKETDALEGLFELVEQSLNQAGLKIETIEAYFFASGPGSTLGIRLVAMAIKTWQSMEKEPKPVYHYQSLILYSKIKTEAQSWVRLLAPWKRGLFMCLELKDSSQEIKKLSEDELVKDGMRESALIKVGRLPKSLPEDLIAIDYDLSDKASFFSLDILSLNEELLPYQIEEPVFQKWTAERHRAT